MNSYVYEFIEFIYEFIEFIYEFMYEMMNSHMNSYKFIPMNSYINSCMNSDT